MKKRLINSTVKTAILSMALLLVSCNDWLTVSPENDLIKDKFWKKTEDVESALAGAYNALRGASLNSFIMGELRADLMVVSGSNFYNYERIAGSDITSTNDAVKWDQYYKAINLANTLMFYDSEVADLDETFTEEMQRGIEAEARFIRSLAYFYLVRLYKDVPLVVEASISDTGNLFIPKSTEGEILNWMVDDLKEASRLAYTDQFVNSWEFSGRANKYAIQALLADVYLWKEDYNTCIRYCDSIINSGYYGLEEPETWFNIYYPGNSLRESIIELQYEADLVDQENPVYNNLLPIGGTGQMTPNTQNINLILDTEDGRRFGGRGALWKYTGKDQLGRIPRVSTEKDVNWIIYRYAEILLMKAEASIELGDYGTANDLITETMLRANMPYIPETDDELIRQALLDERGREFMAEGRRWFDILRAAKRNNFEKKNLIIDMILSGADIKQQAILKTRVYDTLSYYLPIPEDELLYNPRLVQNPFYDR